MERDTKGKQLGNVNAISTHTLTWSVTELRQYTLYVRYISTHTLTWSVTNSRKRSGSRSRNFNSHAHVERDEGQVRECKEYAISTHTLTWSVTTALDAIGVALGISTHTLTWSVTNLSRYYKMNEHISTHTLTWSVTQGFSWLARRMIYFNSHAHVERDS